MKTNFQQQPRSIFNSPEVQNATDVVIVSRTSDGQLQAHATGDQNRAQALYREGAQLLGITEPVG